MKNKEFKKFIKNTKRIKLNLQEKGDIRNSLLYFIKKNPVRKRERERLILQRLIFPFNLNLKTMPIAPILLFFAILMGGTSVAAEQSLPGEFLYPVKVSINEEVRSILSFGPESDAKWEVERVERRLEEVEKLAVENKLTTELVLSIEQSITKHTEKIKSEIVELGNDQIPILEINSNLEAVLGFHEKILSNLAVETEEVSIILPRIKEERKTATTIIIDINNDIITEIILITREIAKRELQLTKEDITEVRKLIAEAKNPFKKDTTKKDERSTIEAQRYLTEAEKLYEQGLYAFDSKDYPNSFIVLKKARRALKMAKSLLAIPIEILIPIDIYRPKDWPIDPPIIIDISIDPPLKPPTISDSERDNKVVSILCSQKPKVGNLVNVYSSTNGKYYALNYSYRVFGDPRDMKTNGKIYINPVLDNPSAYYDSSGNSIGYCGGLLNEVGASFCTEVLPALSFNTTDLCI